MAKKKEDSTKVDLIYTNTDVQITNIDKALVIPIAEQVIDRIHYILNIKNLLIKQLEGYLIGFEYPYAMEVLRYCENKKENVN